MKITKKLSLVALAGVMLALTGCSYHTMADAEATPYSVVELTNATLTENSTFGYTDSEGQVRPLDDCGQPDFFSQKYCQSEGGLVKFTYSIYKGGRVASAAVTVEGVKRDLDCTLDGDDTWSSKYICIPTA